MVETCEAVNKPTSVNRLSNNVAVGYAINSSFCSKYEVTPQEQILEAGRRLR